MKPLRILFFLLNIIHFGTMTGQNYDTMWKLLEQQEQNDQPQSVIETAQKIAGMAEKEKNFPQLLKARIRIVEKECDIDPEQFRPQELEKLLEDDWRPADKAVLHALVGRAYQVMTDSYVRDADEETRENYRAKAVEHDAAALEDLDMLQQTSAKDYVPLVKLQEDGALYEHDLLIVLLDYITGHWYYDPSTIFIRRWNGNIDSLKKCLEQLIKARSIYEEKGNRNAATLLMLRELEMRRETDEKTIHLDLKTYTERLQKLLEETRMLPVGADVAKALLETEFASNDEKLALARESIGRWPKSVHRNFFRNIENSLMALTIRVMTEETILSGKPFGIQISWKNATGVRITVREYAGRGKNVRYLETGKIRQVRNVTLGQDALNTSRRAQNLPTGGLATEQLTLPAGHYLLIAESGKEKQVQEVKVSSLRAVCSGYQNGQYCITVLDNETGRPVKGASLLLWTKTNNGSEGKGDVIKTPDADGKVIVSRTFQYFQAVRDMKLWGTAQEDITGKLPFPYTYGREEEKETIHVQAFTDRAVFRPGQKVCISLLAYTQWKDAVHTAEEQRLLVSVYDPDGQEICAESVTTGKLGTASLEVPIREKCRLGRYTIRIRLEEGECHTSGAHFFYVEEYKRPTFTVELTKPENPQWVLGDTLEVCGTALHFSGVPVQGASVQCTVEYAEEYGWWRRQDWRRLARLETQTDAEGNIRLSFCSEPNAVVLSDSIAIRLQATVTAASGEMQKGEVIFKVKNGAYTPQPEPAVQPQDELTFSSLEFDENHPVEITFRPKEKDVRVYYLALSEKAVALEGWRELGEEPLQLQLPYSKEMGDGVTFQLFYVKRGHLFRQTEEITFVKPEKKLELSWKTFRDRLTPGGQEEWILTVRDQQNRIIPGAELLAVMVDASLDEIRKNNWHFALRFPRIVPYVPWEQSHGNERFWLHLHRNDTREEEERRFDKLMEITHQRWYRGAKTRLFTAASTKSERMDGMAPTQVAGVLRGMGSNAFTAMKEETVVEEEEAGGSTVSLRSNLQETAFFYPHLMTDETGEAHIAFTLPDCLTEWKFMGLVHTQDMQYGLITARAKASRDFMAQLNMPRFLRTGDKGEIRATIQNLCQEEVHGQVTFRICETESGNEIQSLTLPFQVGAGSTLPLSFPVCVDFPEGHYSCEIVATDGKVSDGERQPLPVLSSRVEVVENVPFYLDGAGSKQVDLSTLFNQGSDTATDRTLAITYTDNPALSVFENLKALQNPQHENVPAYSAALYANTVMILLHQQLSQTEAAGAITAFDKELATDNAREALQKLEELQLSNGSWAWFKGMKGSYYMTLAVAEHLTKLMHYLNSNIVSGEEEPSSDIVSEIQPKVEKMLSGGLKYLDREELKRYQEAQKNHQQVLMGDTQVRYLLLAKNPDSRMRNDYLKLLFNSRNDLTIFGRSKAVQVLRRYGRQEEAATLLESIRQYTVYKEGFGRYFATDQAYYSWQDYRLPTQVAAMEVMDNRQYLLDMQLWLLRQKQTQVWENPLNAIDVAHYLLTIAPQETLHRKTEPSLKLDGKKVVLNRTYTLEKGTAAPAEPLRSAGSMEVEKTSPGISWGNVRATFREESLRLQPYSTGELSIERKVMREGNKITVRHILHADRDMDFVSVTSHHAACLEPSRTASGYQWMGGRGAYLEVHDSCIQLFFDHFTRGTCTIDMEYYRVSTGEYQTGMATIECTYAPEFGAHSSGEIF